VLDPTSTANMTINPDVIWWIKKGHVGGFRLHQSDICLFIASIPDQQSMPTKDEKVALSRYASVSFDVKYMVRRIALAFTKIQHDRVDLARLEPRNTDVETDFWKSDLQVLKLDRQHLAVPPRLFRELVVGQHVGADFRLVEVRQSDDRDLLQAEKLGGFRPCVSGDYSPAIIGNHGINDAKPNHRAGYLLDLPFGVRAGITLCWAAAAR